jgi:hypothetical protein
MGSPRIDRPKSTHLITQSAARHPWFADNVLDTQQNGAKCSVHSYESLFILFSKSL